MLMLKCSEARVAGPIDSPTLLLRSRLLAATLTFVGTGVSTSHAVGVVSKGTRPRMWKTFYRGQMLGLEFRNATA